MNPYDRKCENIDHEKRKKLTPSPRGNHCLYFSMFLFSPFLIIKNNNNKTNNEKKIRYTFYNGFHF